MTSNFYLIMQIREFLIWLGSLLLYWCFIHKFIEFLLFQLKIKFSGRTRYKGAEHFGCQWVHWTLLRVNCSKNSDHCKAKVRQAEPKFSLLQWLRSPSVMNSKLINLLGNALQTWKKGLRVCYLQLQGAQRFLSWQQSGTSLGKSMGKILCQQLLIWGQTAVSIEWYFSSLPISI